MNFGPRLWYSAKRIQLIEGLPTNIEISAYANEQHLGLKYVLMMFDLKPAKPGLTEFVHLKLFWYVVVWIQALWLI